MLFHIADKYVWQACRGGRYIDIIVYRDIKSHNNRIVVDCFVVCFFQK